MAFPGGLGSGRVAWVETEAEGVGRWPCVLFDSWDECAAAGIGLGTRDERVGTVSASAEFGARAATQRGARAAMSPPRHRPPHPHPSPPPNPSTYVRVSMHGVCIHHDQTSREPLAG